MPPPTTPRPARIVSLSQRLYGWLLLAYPAPFRATYGADMVQVFGDCCCTAYRQGGPGAVWRLWASTLADLAANIPAEHLAQFHDPLGGTTMAFKRGMDILISLFTLILAAPLMLAVAVMIKLDSRGPVLFSQARLGRYGRRFTMYKFRSMPVQGTAGVHSGQRYTRVGRWLRRNSLDELPQLYNVLRGDMSLIGPRPPLPADVDTQDPIWLTLFSVRPGISGAGQVAAAEMATTDLRALQALNAEYVRGRSLGRDLQLMLKTVRRIARPRGQA